MIEHSSSPPGRRQATKYDELLKAAMEEPGEWFTMPITKTSAQNEYTALLKRVGQEISTVRVRAGLVYLKIEGKST